MLLALVVTDNSIKMNETNRNLKLPPVSFTGETYDSIEYTVQEFFVIYEHYRAYPAI